MKIIDLIKVIIAHNNDILMSYFDIEYKQDGNKKPILDKVTLSSDPDELQILIEHLSFMANNDGYLDSLISAAVKDLDDAPEHFEEALKMLINEAFVEVLQAALKKYKKMNKEEFKNGSIN